MATFNLVRNSRVFFTTNVDPTTGVIPTSGATISNTNTFEIQVLDGFSFSQASNADTVTISEAGNIPVRGQRSFNTSLANVEFSFSTYIRPKFVSTLVKAEESVLWNALLSSDLVGTASDTSFTFTSLTSATLSNPTATTNKLAIIGVGMSLLTVGGYYVVRGVVAAGANQYNAPVKVLSSSTTLLELEYQTAPTSAAASANWGTTGTVKFSKSAWNEHIAVAADSPTTAYSSVVTAHSNKNQLQKFGMYFLVDNILYAVDNCAMDAATVDFGLDGIAMVAWTGKGTALRQLPSTAVVSAANPAVFTGTGNATGTAAAKTTDAQYITNKLSTVTLVSNIGGVSGTSYTLALTGGSISIANNITYVTPANLGTVNIPIGYYTGTRAISGSLNAYLRTGTTNSAGLLSTMLTNASTSVDPKFKLQVEIGGSTNAVRVEALIDGAMLQIPTIDAQAVMSTVINFTAQGSESVQTGGTAVYDLEMVNDMRLRYFSA